MRDGVPLPGSTPPAVISQLAHRVFGPLRPDRVRAMLDYHGLGGHPADRQMALAARHRITTRTVANWTTALTAAGSRLPLSSDLATELTRRTRPGEDHLARTRTATTLGLPAPPPPTSTPAPAGPSQADRAAAAIAARVLAAAGPQPLTVLRTAIERSRRFRSIPPMTTRQLTAALTAIGATHDDRGRWQAPDDATAPDKYRALVAHAAGRDLNRSQMIAALIAAGYAPTSAGALKISNHPLVRHTGLDRYRIVDEGLDA